MATDDLLYGAAGGIAEITLNRPGKLNSITASMVTALHGALDRAEADPTVRAILLRGEGKSFSAGFDLGEVEANTPVETMRAILAADFDIIMRFWHSPKPTISAVQGYVLGGGFELAMACDVTIAANDAIFGEPEPKFGSGIVALLLPWITGPKQAKEMLLFGNDRIPAERAMVMGLINKVVARASLNEEARAMARRAALLDQTAVKYTKLAINRSYGAMGIDGALKQALDLDLVIETTETDESRTFKQILKESGVKAAVAWREARLAPAAPSPQPEIIVQDKTHEGPDTPMSYTALVVHKDADRITQTIERLADDTLPEGNVTVEVEYSTINYKDGLCLTGQGGLVRNYPHVPGIDFAGTVSASSDARFRSGDKVVLTGWRIGEVRWGGYASRTRVDAGQLVPLPAGLTTRQAMAVGTAGLTAALAVIALQNHGMTPDRGEVLVTGASGGVGSIGVALLSSLGYQVAAVTGRPDNAALLKKLGASAIIDRAELAETVKRPLESERWAGCIDAVGGAMLARVLGQMKYGASVAAVGLVAGAALPATVVPFLLRGVNLLGIDSVMQPIDRRLKAWKLLAEHLPKDLLEATVHEANLADVPRLGTAILKGEVTGRTVVALPGNSA
jgi:acrylyl-CoA reductase (NADPH)